MEVMTALLCTLLVGCAPALTGTDREPGIRHRGSRLYVDGAGGTVLLDGVELRSCVVGSCSLELPPGDHLLVAPGLTPPHGRWLRGDAWDWRDAIIYMVVTDRFANGDPGNDQDVDPGGPGTFHGGDLAGLTARLDHLDRLGVNVLWITPVVDQIDLPVRGKGFDHWAMHGYWAEDFTKIEPRLGTEEDLVKLSEALHERGMRLLLDVVLNHPGYHSPWVRDPDWVRSTELGTCPEPGDDLSRCLFGLPDFRLEREEVASAVVGWQLDWIERSGCDGFRVDAVRHIPLPVLSRLARGARSRKDDFLLLGEDWGLDLSSAGAQRRIRETGLDGLVDFSFATHVLHFVQGRLRPEAMAHYLGLRHRDDQLGAHFLDSHDSPGFLHQVEGHRGRMKLGATLLLTTRGIPTIYYGDEVGRATGPWPRNRSDMPPPDRWDLDLLEHHRRLVSARRRHRALSRGSLGTLYARGDLLVFERRYGEDLVVVAVNRGGEPAEAAFACPPGLQGRARPTDLLTQKWVTFALDKECRLGLSPYGSMVLVWTTPED